MREWLVQLRKQQGLTQQQVADRAGISRSYYSGIENGTRDGQVDKIKRIADVLGFDWTIFFESKGRESSRKTTA